MTDQLLEIRLEQTAAHGGAELDTVVAKTGLVERAEQMFQTVEMETDERRAVDSK